MQAQKKQTASKGGRPKKAVKKIHALTVKCNIIERKVIERKAKDAGLTISEYLRDLGLAGKIDRQKKIVPLEILEYKGTLNHLAANFNQVTRKINCNQLLLEGDVSVLFQVPIEIKRHIENVEKYLQ
jgi:hypothetical protein